MKKNECVKRFLVSTLALSLALTPLTYYVPPAYAANVNNTQAGTNGNNATDVDNDLGDFDIIDKDAVGSIKIRKYDFTSAQNDGYVFNWSPTDHDSNGVDSTLNTPDGKTINITSNGKENAEATNALKEYAIKGVEFTYLRVGDVKTLTDINEDGVNGDSMLIYGVDRDLMNILGLQQYSRASKGKGKVAYKLIDSVNYFSSQQINDALKEKLAITRYSGSYSTSEQEGKGTGNSQGERLDKEAGVTVKDQLEKYITEKGNDHAPGVAFAETDADGITEIKAIDLGLYLIVETKVPENVTDTVNPWFVQVPMTTIKGEEWFYDIVCYPKNQTGHPDLDKLVRNAYGTPGLNHDSKGPATYTPGNRVDRGEEYSNKAEIVTNGDTLKGTDYGAWLTNADKNGDYIYNTTVTASEGDILDYILVSKLPRITSSTTYLQVYDLYDTLCNGLSYNNDLKIAIYNAEEPARVNDTTHAIDVWTMQNGTNYNFTCQESKGKQDQSTTIHVSMTKAGLGEINKKYYDGEHYLVAYYTATLESNATTVLGDEGNPNDVTLVWKRTSDNYYNTLEDRSIVYTYGIDLTKTFSDGNKKEEDFKAVQFVLYNETEDYYVQAKQSATDGLYYVTGKAAAKEKATVFSPSKEGKMVIHGLEGDNYAMTEIATAKGYSILQNQLSIVINTASRDITPSSVHYMTAAKDYDVEHPNNNHTFTLSDGTPLDTLEEGTTDKQNMFISDLNPSSATVDDIQATLKEVRQLSLGLNEINATKNAQASLSSESAAVLITIENGIIFLLPMTGGVGMSLVTILGVVGFIVSLYFLFAKKKRTC